MVMMLVVITLVSSLSHLEGAILGCTSMRGILCNFSRLPISLSLNVSTLCPSLSAVLALSTFRCWPVECQSIFYGLNS